MHDIAGIIEAGRHHLNTARNIPKINLTFVTLYAIVMSVDIFLEEEKMLPSEMIILLAIVVNGKTGEKFLTRPMDITSEYIGYLYNSLVNRGYLKHHGWADYQLTPAGRAAILDLIRKNKSRSKDVVKRLQLLGIEMSSGQIQKIDKLEKEAISAKLKNNQSATASPPG
jgi:predicted transcriptional regulator